MVVPHVTELAWDRGPDDHGIVFASPVSERLAAMVVALGLNIEELARTARALAAQVPILD